MKKLTKKEINLIWGCYFNERGLYVAKSYIINDTPHHCARYHGEALDEALVNSTYDDCVDLLDTIQMSDDMYKSDFISSIHCEINDMIERYNKKKCDKVVDYDDLVSVADAAAELGTTRQALYYHISKGRLEAYPDGVTRKSLERFKIAPKGKGGRKLGSKNK